MPLQQILLNAIVIEFITMRLLTRIHFFGVMVVLIPRLLISRFSRKRYGIGISCNSRIFSGLHIFKIISQISLTAGK